MLEQVVKNMPNMINISEDMNMEEQMKIVDKAIKERRYYLESINPPKNV